MTALAESRGVHVLAARGMHPDRWCEPSCSMRIGTSKKIGMATALVWLRPNPVRSYRARWSVRIDEDEPFVCEIEPDRPTSIGFMVNRDANCTFEIDFCCDYQVVESGADKRDLSFVLTELTLCPDDAVPALDARLEAARFGAMVWTDDAALQGRLHGCAPDTFVHAFVDGQKVAEARTDGEGVFLLRLSQHVAGHSPRTLNVVAEDASTWLDIVLDPAAVGDSRAKIPLPVHPSAKSQKAFSDSSLGGACKDSALLPVIEAMAVQTEALRALLSRSDLSGNAPQAVPDTTLPTIIDRYGALFENSVNNGGVGHDIIFLGVIDWNFRIQRPQHIATDLARRANRVFYISIVFGTADSAGRFQILQSPVLGVYEVQLKLGCALPPNIYRSLEPQIVSEILAALDEMIAVLSIRAPAVVVEYPSWAPVAFGIAGATVIHDCLDLVSGFEGTPPEIVELEDELVASADVVVTTSKPLSDLLAPRRRSVLIRNGADIDVFAAAAKRPGVSSYKGKVIGYFGAIAHWFDADWIVRAAEAHSDWTIVLIGAVDPAHVPAFASCANIVALGERPYSELVQHLAEFDVAVIPFKLVDLILCTNPVKLYEYMAAGKPVVASAMPEVVRATDLVYVAHDADEFVAQIERALVEDSDHLRAARIAWAQEHSWETRGEAFLALLDDASPTVSVVVLSYKNWEFTQATLWSIVTFSDYANLEIIVVDNGSGDDVVRNLQRFAARDARIKLVLSNRNLGYAAGNNLGLQHATGEYIILLNNDTYVTKGWVRDLIRPLMLDQTVGLVSPLTNNIGNEQRVSIEYSNMEEMARASRSIVRQRSRERFETECVAFFCVAMRRDVLEKLGPLDETYGLGFFEDDDYCKRAVKAGYRIQIIDDVFVHHHLSASFNQLGQTKKEQLMAQNRAIFEARWGPWKPHSHRRAAGFG